MEPKRNHSIWFEAHKDYGDDVFVFILILLRYIFYMLLIIFHNDAIAFVYLIVSLIISQVRGAKHTLAL